MKSLKDAILSHINETINVSMLEATELASDIVAQHEAYNLETLDWQITQDACNEYAEVVMEDNLYMGDDDWY